MPQAEVELRFVNVGQGAALLITSHDTVILVDGGPAEATPALRAALWKRGQSAIDLWLVTHYDEDHIGAGVELFQPGSGVTVAQVWDPGEVATPGTQTYARYVALGLPREAPRAFAHWASDGASVLALPGVDQGAANELGLSACVEVQGFGRVFATGDLPAKLAGRWVEACARPEVWWASHHGAADGWSADLLRDLNPNSVVISAGWRNRHCHPDFRLLTGLRGVPVTLLSSAVAGPGRDCPAPLTPWDPAHVWLGADFTLSPP